MKLKTDFALRQVAGTWVVLPLSGAVDFRSMLKLNETGALLWKALEQGGDREALADALCAAYIVDRKQALADVEDFLGKLNKLGCLEL